MALSLTLATDNDVTIEADPGLSGAVRVVGDQLDCLRADDGMAMSISTSGCDSDVGHLDIMVPPSIPLTLEVESSGNVSVGDLKGPLKAVVSSDGDLKIRGATVLQLDIRGSGDAIIQSAAGPTDLTIDGSGDVRILRLSGPLKVRQNGSGDLGIGQITSPATDIEARGSGDTLILGGHIDFLRARTEGSGDIVMRGGAGAAELYATGGGDIGLGHADGPVVRHGSDGSTINVGPGGEIASAAIAKLRSAMGGGDDAGDDAAKGVTVHHGGSGFHDFLAFIGVAGAIFVGWRIFSRRGARRVAVGGAPAAPTDPGVVALCSLLAGLERRLAQVETHVTSREFELNRKFRDIEAGR